MPASWQNPGSHGYHRQAVSRRSATGWLLVVLTATLAVYAPSLANTFAFDDRFVAKAVFDSGAPNPTIRPLRSPFAFFGEGYWSAVDERSDRLYRPLTVLSFACVYHALGRHLAGHDRGDDRELGEALPQHAVNLLLHALAVWLAYRLLRGAGAARGPAVVGTAVFGLHAIHSEVVAALVGRAELLAFVTGTGMLLCVRRRPVLAAVLLFAAACAKENGLVFAPIAAVWLVATGTPTRAALVRTVLTSLAPIAAYSWLRASALHGLPELPPSPAVNPLAALPTGERLLTATMVLGHGLWQTLWPFDLRAEYSIPEFRIVRSAADARFVAAAFGLSLVLGAGALAGRRRPLVLLGTAFFVLPSLAVSNLPFTIGTIYGERLYFTPSFALACAVAALPGFRQSALARRIGFVVLLAWLAASAATILRRNPVWRDDASLFAAEVARDDAPARMHFLHAKELARAGGDPALVRHHLERAVELHPGFGAAWNDLAAAWLAQGRVDDARAALRRGIGADDKTDATRYLLLWNWAMLAIESGPAEIGSARAAIVRAAGIDGPRLLRDLDAALPRIVQLAPPGWLEDTLAELGPNAAAVRARAAELRARSR
jgi:hypothetical protein